MAIINVSIPEVGEVGVNPRVVKVQCTDSYAVVTAAGYLNNTSAQGFNFKVTDVFMINYGTNSATFGMFTPTFSAGIMTLNAAEGSVELPVVANHIAVFANTSGALKDDAATAINGGNIQAGLSGTAGTLASYPATAAKGSLKVVAVANTNDTVTTISNSAMAQASVISIPDPATATAKFAVAPAALVNNNLVKASGTAGLVADAGIVAANVVTNATGGIVVLPNAINAASYPVVIANITVSAAALATGGSVTLLASTGSHTYQILEIFCNAGGTNFSGGSGNRLAHITDGTNEYTLIPAASLQALANARWGSTAVPYPAAVAIKTPSAAGVNVRIEYNGGTTDYSAGSMVITVIAAQLS